MLSLLLFFFVSIARPADSLEHNIWLVLPRPYMVITGNSVRLLAEPSPGFSPKEVRFYISYKAGIDSLKFRQNGDFRKYLGTIVQPPYELLADLSGIPDQDEYSLNFFLEAEDSFGRVWQGGFKQTPHVLLDRNQTFSAKVLKSAYTRHSPHIDADLGDWHVQDSISFLNAENIVTAYSQWDNTYLYFGITVFDDSIMFSYSERGYLWGNTEQMPRPAGLPDDVPLFLSDEVELFFDTDHCHGYFRTLKDMHFLIGAGNAFYGRKYDRKLGVSELWGATAACSVRVWDHPSRYTIEVAFPWAELGLNPEKGLTMGFDLFNKDYMFTQGPSTSKSWSGVEYTNYNNPSEWANLELVGNAMPAWIIVACGFGLVMGILVLGLLWKKRQRIGIQNSPRNELIVKNIEAYIKTHFSDPELNVTNAAAAIGTSAKYVGGLFRTYMKMSVNQYLNNLRLDKARELLRSTDKTITEITFEVGYASPDYFTKVFKAAEGMVPSEYRLRAIKTAKSQ